MVGIAALEFSQLKFEQVPWDELDSFEDREVCQTKPWIDFVLASQGGHPVVAALRDRGQTVGYFTGIVVSKLGVPILGSPFVGWTTPYMGMNLRPGISRTEALAALERFAFGELNCLHVELADRHLTIDEATQIGFDHTVIDDYVTDLSKTEDELFASMSSSCRRCVRKATKSGVTIEEAGPEGFASEFYDQYLDVFAKQGLRPNYPLSRVEDLIEHMYPSGHILLLRARGSDGKGIATGIFVGMNSHSLFWGNASYREFQGLRPNQALHWYALRYWKARGVRWHGWGGGGNYKQQYGPTHRHKPQFFKSRYPMVGWARKAAKMAYYGPRNLVTKFVRGR